MSIVAGFLFIGSEAAWWMIGVSCGLSYWTAGSLARIRTHTKRAAKNLSVKARRVHDFSGRELDALPGKPVTSLRVGFIVAAGLLVTGIIFLSIRENLKRSRRTLFAWNIRGSSPPTVSAVAFLA